MTFEPGCVYNVNGIHCIYLQKYNESHLFMDANSDVIQISEKLPNDPDELLKLVENYGSFKRNPDVSRWV